MRLLRRMIEVGALKFGDFVLSSGKRSSVYVDVKLASTYPDILDAVSDEICRLLEGVEFDRIACVELGGVPIAVATALKCMKPLVIFRKQKKDYGLGGDRIGDIREGERVVIVEDVVTTGASAMSAAERVEKAGGKVVKIVAVVDREEGKVEVDSVMKLSDLLKAKELLESSEG